MEVDRLSIVAKRLLEMICQSEVDDILTGCQTEK